MCSHLPGKGHWERVEYERCLRSFLYPLPTTNRSWSLLLTLLMIEWLVELEGQPTDLDEMVDQFRSPRLDAKKEDDRCYLLLL